jgi:hypothetical protein
MSDPDIILVSQSNVVDYDAYSNLPLDRLDLFKSLVYPRMVHHEGEFRSHLDYLNFKTHGKAYAAADYSERRRMLNIWNLPSASGIHLANYLSQFGFDVCVINNIDSEWDIFEQVYRSCQRPPLVGISSTFYLSWKEVGRVAAQLRKLDPDMEIVLGGAFANAEFIGNKAEVFERPMRKHGIRYVLHAFNSEADLRDMLAVRRSNGDLDGVLNLCRVEGSFKSGRFEATKDKWNDPLLADAPARWDRLDLPFLNRTIQIRTASGCPFSCAFCSYPTTAHGWKTLQVDRVRAHLDSICRIPKIDRIIFIDDTFNVPPYLGAISFFITFAVMGIWHGTTGYFLVFGLLLGLGVSVNRLWQIVAAKRLGRDNYRLLCERTIYADASRSAAIAFFSMSLICFWLDDSTARTLLSLMGVICCIVAFAVITATGIVVIAGERALMRTLQPFFARWIDRYGPQAIELRARWIAVAVWAIVLLTIMRNGAAPDFVYQGF